MKNRKNILIITLLIILSLSLFIGCKAKTPVPDALDTEEAHQEQQAQNQPKEEPQAESTSEISPPAKEEPINPTESGKSTGTISTKTEKPAETNNNKTSLQIEGSAIVNPITLNLDELKAMKDYYVEDDFFSLNSYGTKEYFHFKGVKIKAILDKVGINKNTASITFVASDGYKQELTVEQALKEDYIDEQNPDKKYPVIIAWHENGKDYDAQKDAPFRLVIGQKESGDVNKPQWVQNVSKIIID